MYVYIYIYIYIDTHAFIRIIMFTYNYLSLYYITSYCTIS